MVDFEYASEVPMTPDGSVVWDVVDCPEIGGSMLTAPDCPEGVVGALRKVAGARALDPHALIGRSIGGGAASIIYEWPAPRLAFKVIHDFKLPTSEYEALRANVTLAEGLKRIPGSRSGRATYTAPTYHGAYFPYEIGGSGTSVWAMTLEAGEHRHELPAEVRRTIPKRNQRAAVYRKALQACGGDAGGYDLDMDENNEIYRVTPAQQQTAMGKAAMTIVKLDISDARSIFDVLKMR